MSAISAVTVGVTSITASSSSDLNARQRSGRALETTKAGCLRSQRGTQMTGLDVIGDRHCRKLAHDPGQFRSARRQRKIRCRLERAFGEIEWHEPTRAEPHAARLVERIRE